MRAGFTLIGLIAGVFGIIGVVGSRPAIAQDATVVPDTLDWQRYYPLEVGNTWEYEGLDRSTSTIVGDTLANGKRYFIQRDSIPAVGTLGPFIHIFYARYDTASMVLFFPSIEADTITVRRPFEHTADGFQVYIDLQAAFGDTLYYAPPDSLYYVSGGYNEEVELGFTVVEVDALKCFNMVFWSGCYATDIGFTGGGNLFGSKLKYARVGGIEYGRSSTTTEAELPNPAGPSLEAIYPNPTRGETTIRYHVPQPTAVTIEAFDVLGRRVWWETLPAREAGAATHRLPGQEFVPGMYLVRLTTDSGEQSVRSVVVAVR